MTTAKITLGTRCFSRLPEGVVMGIIRELFDGRRTTKLAL